MLRSKRQFVRAALAAAVAPACLALAACAASAPSYDLVIANGRVMDPETGLDAQRNVAISNGEIVEISAAPLKGRKTIDAAGLVVAPGFIDLHAHGQDLTAYRLHAQDGVTTSLEMEEGAFPVGGWYKHREGRSPINYGATVKYMWAKAIALGAATPEDLKSYEYETPAKLLAAPQFREIVATPDQHAKVISNFKQGLDEGGLGLGFNLAETPGVSREQLFDYFKLAAQEKVPVFIHVRSLANATPVEAAQEVIANAKATGAAAHMPHVNSSGLQYTRDLVGLVAAAQQEGVNVSTEVYPYDAASTSIGAPHVAGALKSGMQFDKLEWAATGERLTERSFFDYLKKDPGGILIAHVMDEADVAYAVAHPIVMIASDQMRYLDGRAHPRGAGTHARVLGHYVRDQKALTLMSALNKMTLLPARRLEAAVPEMKRRGRVQKGMIADLTVFDPAKVADRATFRDPALPSAGIAYVLVRGQPVVDRYKLVENSFPGVPIRRAAAR